MILKSKFIKIADKSEDKSFSFGLMTFYFGMFFKLVASSDILKFIHMFTAHRAGVKFMLDSHHFD